MERGGPGSPAPSHLGAAGPSLAPRQASLGRFRGGFRFLRRLYLRFRGRRGPWARDPGLDGGSGRTARGCGAHPPSRARSSARGGGVSNRQRGRYRPPRAADSRGWEIPGGGALLRPRPRTRREPSWTGGPGMPGKKETGRLGLRGEAGRWLRVDGDGSRACRSAPRQALGAWDTSERSASHLLLQDAFTSPAGSPGCGHMPGVMGRESPRAFRHPSTAPGREEGATGSAALTSPRPPPRGIYLRKGVAAAGTGGAERPGEAVSTEGRTANRSKLKGCCLLPHPTGGSETLPSLPDPSPRDKPSLASALTQTLPLKVGASFVQPQVPSHSPVTSLTLRVYFLVLAPVLIRGDSHLQPRSLILRS